MSEAFSSISQGMNEAIEFAKGQEANAVVHQFSPPDVKAIREKLGMTQTELASTFGISLGTLRHWEQGDRTPHGPALVLLSVMTHEPESVLRTLAASRKAYDSRS